MKLCRYNLLGLEIPYDQLCYLQLFLCPFYLLPFRICFFFLSYWRPWHLPSCAQELWQLEEQQNPSQSPCI